MTRGNKLVFLIVLIIFALAVCALVYPVFGREEIRLGLDLQGGIHLVYQADFSEVEPGAESEAIDGAIAVIERRINIFGVTEPIIQRQGDDRIVVELPGVSEVEEAKELIGQTALIEFREQVINEEGETEWIPLTGTINGVERVLTSNYFEENTYVGQDNLGRLLLYFEWNDEGKELCAQITPRILGQPMGIYLSGEPLLGEDGYPLAPIVNDALESCNTIEGLSYNDATELSRLLNAGRIPLTLTPIYEQTVSPTLGEDFVDMSLKAGMVGIILVMLFMIAYYRIPGFIASLALVYYAVLLLAIFKLFGVTLTLAGIGGFILSVGMAIDANVLIFERMKEELRAKRTLGAAIETGFSRAWPAIWDSNVTTILAALILFWLGSSIVASAPLKGFALTLIIGVAVSMLTAVMVTRTFLRPFVGTGLARRTSLFTPYQRKET